MLTIPNLPELTPGVSTSTLAADLDIVDKYEKLVTEWEQQIIEALRIFTSKVS